MRMRRDAKANNPEGLADQEKTRENQPDAGDETPNDDSPSAHIPFHAWVKEAEKHPISGLLESKRN